MAANSSCNVTFSRIFLIIPVLALYVYACNAFDNSCNGAVCGSIVTKCWFLQSCKCDANNISCKKNCADCLDKFYLECCSCVEKCPKGNELDSYLSMKSHVEEIEPITNLFSVLTEGEDKDLRWMSYTYPAELSEISMNEEMEFIPARGGETTTEPIPVNCTVAYQSQCMYWNQCKTTCESMEASSYRWFYNGCCECVGSTCRKDGINESRCLDCPPDNDQTTTEELNVTTKDSKKLDEEFSGDKTEEDPDSLDKDEKFDGIQTVDS